MKNLKEVIPTPELLQEMEELEILGGEGDGTVVNTVSGCATDTYCSGGNCGNCGNCVPHCACTITPQPPIVTNKTTNCSNLG